MLPVIMEWVILLLLVPAIVVPVVLCFGFAGCSFELPRPFVITSIEPTALNTLTVKWSDADPHGIGFEIHRTKVSDGTRTVKKAEFSDREFTDDGLEPATQYRYAVDRIPKLLEDTPTPEVTGTTLGPAFLQDLPQDVQGLQEFTLVQRIEPVRLMAGGNRVAITVRSARFPSLTLATLYISQAASPESPHHPYDSAADIKKVIDEPVFVPFGHAATLPVIDYTLDPGKPLLVAFECLDGTQQGGNFGRITGVPATEATVYRSPRWCLRPTRPIDRLATLLSTTSISSKEST
jgi:hypothetical protein